MNAHGGLSKAVARGKGRLKQNNRFSDGVKEFGKGLGLRFCQTHIGILNFRIMMLGLAPGILIAQSNRYFG